MKITKFTTAWILVIAAIFSFSLKTLRAELPGPVPESWKAEWEQPSAQMRPLQIVHGWIVPRDTPEKMAFFRDECGLGGLVCNIGHENYLYDESQWRGFVEAVRIARSLGLRIWIYDEDGYPSPEAGGVLLRENPELECLALVYDKNRERDPFHIRPAFEFTHAASNYAAIRRYPNLLDARTTEKFLRLTHQQYRDRLGPELFEQIEAFFTDEPSLNAVNIGTIPEEAAKRVWTVDSPDYELKPLPMIAWFEDIPEKYREKYGEDLLPLRKSLFEGDSEKDKTVRRNFWSLIGDLHSERFYGAIQRWCKENGSSLWTPEQPDRPLRIASSGHTLHEEPLVAHAALDGNKLQVLRRMDVPGLDMLNSDPGAVFWGAWKAAAFPASAAESTGRRLIMTEVSDFSQAHGPEGHVDLSAMCATASWQAAWGITEFTLYYAIETRGAENHRKYCDYVGRLNAILRSATPVREVYLYYPITEMQEEYIPQADPIDLKKQSERMQEFVRRFEQLGAELMRRQVPFTLTDRNWTVEQMKAERKGKKYFVRSHLDEIPWDDLPRLQPRSDRIVLGRFQRVARDIFLLLNTDKEVYEGRFFVPISSNEQLDRGSHRRWMLLDPASGEIRPLESEQTQDCDRMSLQLAPNQTLLLVGF